MHSHYLNGQWTAGEGAEFAVIDPSTGQQIWSVRQASAEEVEAACSAAREKFPLWASMPLDERIAVCRRFSELLTQSAEELALLIAQEVGKPLWEARTEVTSMANKVEISVQAYQERTGTSSRPAADGTAVVRHRPHGVFAVFGPYNFPGHLPNGHIVPALIAGNTIVFKPSEYAPRTALKTAELWERAGLPGGVLNVVNGAAATGVVLAQQRELDGILFTGSYRTGAMLHKQFGGQPGKMLALEMGGNNALLAWKIGNVDAAVHHTVFSAFVSAGQRCTCARRLIVEDIRGSTAFVDRLVEVARNIRIGRFDASPPPFMGPLVSAQAADRLMQVQEDLLARGGKPLLAMHRGATDTGFVSPGIIDVTNVGELPDEEFFGPLLQVIRVADFEQALRVANATEYGLAAGLLSEDESLWQRFLIGARAGVVNWNRPLTGAASTAPFGGIGKSGNHRPSAWYAADYCAYPVASIENNLLEMPRQLSPGLVF